MARTPTELLERERELAEVDAALARAADGEGQVLVIEGPGGIGKTRLLGAARERTRSSETDIRGLGARGSELERSFPFGVVRQLFEPLVFGATTQERDLLFSGAAGLVRPMFDPAAAAAAGRAGVGAAEEDAGYARLHGLFWLAANLAAERPLLLTVDDAQWADEPSLTFLGFLQRRLEALPILVLLGTRPRPEQTSEILREIVADPSARVVRPSALSEAAVGRWVRQAVSEQAGERFVAACKETTNGNPFLLGELLREVLAKGLTAADGEADEVRALGPEAISTVVLLRLRRLPAAAPDVARAIAILGEGAQTEFAAALAGHDLTTTLDAIEALRGAEVLTRDGPLTFVHPIVLHAVYHDLPVRMRMEGHERAAALLHERGEGAQKVASQLMLAPPRGEDWRIGCLRAAAAASLRAGDPAQAAAYLRRALDEPPSGDACADVLTELGTAELKRGSPGAARHFERALELAVDPRQRGTAALGLSRAYKWGGDSVLALQVLKDAAGAIGDEHPALRAELEVERLMAAYISFAARPMMLDEIRAITEPDTGRPPQSRLEQCQLVSLAFETALSGGPSAEAARYGRRALEGPPIDTDVEGGPHIFISAAIALQFAERVDEAEALYTRGITEAQRRGSGPAFVAFSSMRCLLRLRRGRLDEAEADANAALDLRSEVTAVGYVSCALNTVACAALDRGRVDEDLLAYCDDFLATYPGDDLPWAQAQHGRAVVRAALGRQAEALEELLAAGEREDAWGAVCPSIVPWRSSAALVALDLGQADLARRLASDEARIARDAALPRALGVALRARALCETGDERLSLLGEAVDVLSKSYGVLEHARAQIDLGTALLATGRRSDARALLRAGLDVASRSGAEALVERAHRELVATGARPRRTAVTGRDALTPSERRVVEMAAEGMINREIAQALFVTEKTVETHLGRAYTKLGVRSRRELAGAMVVQPLA